MSPLKKLEFISVILSNSDSRLPKNLFGGQVSGCYPCPNAGGEVCLENSSMNFPWGSLLRQGDIQGIYYFYDLFKRIQESLELN